MKPEDMTIDVHLIYILISSLVILIQRQHTILVYLSNPVFFLLLAEPVRQDVGARQGFQNQALRGSGYLPGAWVH